MNRKVTYLRVHELKSSFDGILNFRGNCLPLPDQPNLPITMVEGPNGVEVRVEVGKGLGRVQIIPYANIQKYDVEHINPAPTASGSGPATTKVVKPVPTVASPKGAPLSA